MPHSYSQGPRLAFLLHLGIAVFTVSLPAWSGEENGSSAAAAYQLKPVAKRFASVYSQLPEKQHAIYAVSFMKTNTHFPLVWDPGNRSVSAVNVTRRYKPKKAGRRSVDEIEKLLQEKTLNQLADSDQDNAEVSLADLPRVRKLIVNKYVKEIQNSSQRQTEHTKKVIAFGDKTMRYDYVRIGKKPAAGFPLYIALHGGGGAPARVNDSQWQHMKRYYRKGVKQGIYLAPRGITNTWNLHFRKESYACYSRIIENMIAFAGVDPNRVYLMGFSAGGDAVYQVAARMPDRWAAMAMSAGHPNGVSVDNYCNLPFLIQVGAQDAAYKRNTVAAEYSRKLSDFAKKHPGYYVHDCFVHVGRGHNFVDFDTDGRAWPVYASSREWLTKGNQAKVVKKNTNSIHWLKQHARDPYPEMVIWNYAACAEREVKPEPEFWPSDERGKLNYWLGLDRYKQPTPLQAERIKAEYDRKQNLVRVVSVGNYLVIYLNGSMVDLSEEITLEIGEQVLTCKPRPTLQNLVRSLLDRGDPNYMFPVRIPLILNQENDWVIGR